MNVNLEAFFSEYIWKRTLAKKKNKIESMQVKQYKLLLDFDLYFENAGFLVNKKV